MNRLAVSLVLAWLAGCSSSNASQSAAEATDAQAPEAGDDAGAEAGPVAVDQDPNVYPAKHHPMVQARNFGGKNLYAMKIVTVTFAGDAWRDDLRAFDDGLVASDWWKLVGHSYQIDVGTSGGYAELSDTLSGKTSDDASTIQPLLQAQIANHTLPLPDDQTLYVLYAPQAATITYQGDTSCASGMKSYHNWTNVQIGSTSVHVPYVVVARCTSAESDAQYAASHEIIEAATDPFPGNGALGWYILDNNAFTGPGGAEIADICVGTGQVTTGNNWTAARVWSNEAAAASHNPCQPSDPSRVFYGAVPETETVTVSDITGTHASDGYITLGRGASKDVLVVVFSEAALPHDLSLSVTLPSGARGITATLSKKTGHNGTELLMTMTAAATVTSMDYGFLVRATLSPTDSVAWPVILRVQ